MSPSGTAIRRPGLSLRTATRALALAALCSAPSVTLHAQSPGPLNALTPDEAAAGWKLLFDGKSNAGWVRPDGSAGRFGLEDEALKAAGGDICTEGEYRDFDFTADYRYETGGNSGFFLRTRRGANPPYRSGLEIAIQDNGRAGNLCETCDAAVYDIKAPSVDKWTGPGKWNTQRIRLAGTKLDVWHNGSHVIDLDQGTAEWAALAKASKFLDGTWPEWNKEAQGQICLQDHGMPVWFRNLKVLPLGAASLPRAASPAGLRWEIRGGASDRRLAVELPGGRGLELAVLDPAGRQVGTSRSRGSRAELPLRALPPGLYWLRVTAPGVQLERRFVLL